MGQKISGPDKQPSQAEMSGVVEARSVGEGVGPAQEELPVQEGDFIDVPLVNVNQTTLKQVEVGEAVEVQGFRVLTGKGPIGEIPHALRDTIEEGNYRTGVILSIDTLIVRLYKK